MCLKIVVLSSKVGNMQINVLFKKTKKIRKLFKMTLRVSVGHQAKDEEKYEEKKQ